MHQWPHFLFILKPGLPIVQYFFMHTVKLLINARGRLPVDRPGPATSRHFFQRLLETRRLLVQIA
jgi:hypothetical protein